MVSPPPGNHSFRVLVGDPNFPRREKARKESFMEEKTKVKYQVPIQKNKNKDISHI